MLSNNYLPREEKYPNISQEEFIPIEYIHPSGVTIPGDIYVINKIGEVKNIKTGKILKITVNKNYCRVFLSENFQIKDIIYFFIDWLHLRF